VTRNASHNELLQRLTPPIAGVLLAAVFAALGFWQIERASEKKALEALFERNVPYTQIANLGEPTPYRPIEARGRYLPGQQVLIDNIVRSGRIGYFVISALDVAPDQPLLLVNRGWVPKAARGEGPLDLALDDGWRSVYGRVGHLPRVGIRSGDAFAGAGDWPKVAVYPTADEVAAELGRSVLPYVLLLDPEDPDGYSRDWRPQQAGPMRHYGYAVQWFAMCATVIALGLWHYRRARAGR